MELSTTDRLHRYKKRIVYGILAVLTASIVLTLIGIAAVLRTRLIEDGKQKTRELGFVIQSSLSHLMLARDPGGIQETLETIGRNGSSVIRSFILDKNGRVAYSTAREDVGKTINRFQERSCRGCHRDLSVAPRETTLILEEDGVTVLRNVNVIPNERQCHGCHDPADRINGKIIIDRAMGPTTALVTTVMGVIAGSGVICLVVLVPLLRRFVSKGVDTYIDEIILKSTELAVLYGVVERLSRTIELEELKQIVIDIVRDALDADVIHVLLPREGSDYGGVTWTRAENRIERARIGKDDTAQTFIVAWTAEALPGEVVSPKGDAAAIPIVKGDNRLGLIIVKKTGGRFEASRLGLIRALRGHIAVALENALLYQIAITDELTGLYTKRHFRHVIEKKFGLFERFGEKLTLLMLDIDHFKLINDSLGHPAGDAILKEIALCIVRATRDEDTDFRYGGEEFVVILPGTDASGGWLVAERIRRTMEEHVFRAGAETVTVTVSVGVASCPENALSIKDLILEADRALYEAKRRGRNRVVVSETKAV